MIKNNSFHPSGRDDNPAETNNDIFIEATKHILQEDGYDHLTIREIAQRAGYNAATLYHYFRDLDELIILWLRWVPQ